MRSLILCGAFLVSFVTGIEAQSFDDLTLVRNRPSSHTSVFKARLGALGSIAGDEDKDIGLESQTNGDGQLYYYTDRLGGREATLDLLVDRTSVYAGVREGSLRGSGSISRAEVYSRHTGFYRDGFYDGGEFTPTGRYGGKSYGTSMSMGRELAADLYMELGAFYGQNSFEENADTKDFIIPDNFDVYGTRLWLEHNVLQLDRMSGRPDAGFILTMLLEQEWNDSGDTFGVQTGLKFQSKLPSSVFRGRAHLEWYFSQSQSGAWIFLADGQYTDEKDRVFNTDAHKPIGNLWIDSTLGFRWDITDSLWMTPYANIQWVNHVNESGEDADSEIFFGGGVDMGFDLSDSFSLIAEYSYLNNESRSPVSMSEDVYGEHMFFSGIEMRFGARKH